MGGADGLGGGEDLAHGTPDLLERIREIVAQRGDEIAVEAPDASLTYSELDRLSNQLAHWLIALAGDRALRIGISIPRGATAIVAMLATMKAGSTYVPIDFSGGPDWLRRLVDAVAPHLLIVDPRSPLVAIAPDGPGDPAPRLLLDDVWRATEKQDPQPPRLHFEPAQLAYIAFVPASAGPPGGLEVSRSTMGHLLDSMASDLARSDGERRFVFTTKSSDDDVLGLFLPLWMGATIVIVDHGAATDPIPMGGFPSDEPMLPTSLVTLRKGDEYRPPLFLVHDPDGEPLVYYNLARRIAGGRSVYAVRPFGRGDAPLVQTRIEDMAASYVREIRQVRPHGPYLLGGLSTGGVLAFEMALQLEAANEEARLIALFDAADVEARAKPLLHASRRIRRFRQAIRTAPFRQVPRAVAGKVFGYLSYEVEVRLSRARERFAVATFGFCERWGLPLPPWAKGLTVRRLYAGAESKYRPASRVREEIVLFRATEGDGPYEPFVAAYADPLLGWGRRSAKGARAIDVPTGHATMLQEPSVGFIADALRSYLDDDEASRRAS